MARHAPSHGVPPHAGRLGRLGVAVVVALLLSSCGGGSSNKQSGGSSGAPQQKQTMVVALSVADPIFAQLFVAKEAGLFDKQGLNVVLNNVGVNAVTAVVSGQADLGFVGAPSALLPVKQGKATTVIYNNFSGTLSGFMAGTTNVKSPADCTKVATQNVGTNSYGWVQLVKNVYNAHYSIVPFADVPTVVGALVGGTVDCALTSLPTLDAAVEQHSGLHVLLDGVHMPPTLQHTGSSGVAWGMKDNLERKKDAVVKFLRAYNAAEALMKSSSEDDIASFLLKNSDMATAYHGDKAAIAHAVKLVEFSYYPDDGKITQAVWTDILNFAVTAGVPNFDPKDPDFSYGARVDMSYLDQASK